MKELILILLKEIHAIESTNGLDLRANGINLQAG